jgi:hypothetical protein
MTARQRLVSDREIDRVFAKLREHGIDVTKRGVDILADGVRVYPPATESTGTSAYDRWKAQDARRDQDPHRH